MSRVWIAITIALMLGACTPGRIDRVHVSSSYMAVQYRHVPYTNYLHADVSGNPFNMDQATFSALVSDAIQPYRGMPPTSSGYHVHMAFNGPTTTSEDYACQTHGETANFGGDIHLIAAFCGGSNRAITYLVGSVSGITGPDDPNFAKFVRWAVVELFPPYDDSDQRQSDFCFIPGC